MIIWVIMGVAVGFSAGVTLVNWLDFLAMSGYAGGITEELLQEEE